MASMQNIGDENRPADRTMVVWRRRLGMLAYGGIALGVVTAFDTVDLAQLITNFLSQLVSILIAIFLGGQVTINQ